MLLVVALLTCFCLVGLTIRRFDKRAGWLLLAGIAVLVLLDLVRRTLS